MMKRIAILFAALLFSAASAFSQSADIERIQEEASTFADTLASALPFNSTIGLNWSDAYTGNFPHLGFGITAGVTVVDSDKVSPLLTELGYSYDSSIPLAIPAAVGEVRVGGLILPFDVGLKAGFIPETAGEALSSASGGLTTDYLLVGADVRYALLKGGILIPKVSIGVGFNYLKGSVSTAVGSSESYTYSDGTTDYTITADAPTLTLEWESKTIDFKVQASKSLLIFTPYIGAGFSYGWSSAGYSVKSDVTGDIEAMQAALESAGIDSPDISSTGISYTKSVTGYSARAFGGLSVNLLIVKLDLTGLYNFNDGTYGASAGARIQF
jgi:hypothetical protein